MIDISVNNSAITTYLIGELQLEAGQVSQFNFLWISWRTSRSHIFNSKFQPQEEPAGTVGTDGTSNNSKGLKIA
jgi:hypothetical protein